MNIFRNYKKKPTSDITLSYDIVSNFWYEKLLNFELSLFDWEGLPFKQKYLEFVLINNGIAAIDNGGISIYACNLFAPNKFYGGYSSATLVTPLEVKTALVKDIATIYNTETGCSSINRIIYYTMMLTHASLTLQSSLINSRNNGVFIVNDDDAKNNVDAWYKLLAKGAQAAIVGKNHIESLLSDKPIDLLQNTSAGKISTLPECMQAVEDILRMYYRDIGINMAADKKERMVVDEVSSSNIMLKFNIDNMLKCRKDGCEEVNKKYGTKWDVKINERIGKFDGDN